MANFEVEARKLDNKVWLVYLAALSEIFTVFIDGFFYLQDFFGKSDPYLEFFKETATGWQLAHRTEVNSSFGRFSSET